MDMARLNLGMLAFVLCALAFAAHFPALSHYYVQDDVQAILLSQHWRSNYQSIVDTLQYRPNTYALHAFLELFLPREPWVMRLFGIAIIIAIASAMFGFMRSVTGKPMLGVQAAILCAVAPGFYAYPNLYLTATMTGLGVLLLVLTVWQAHRFAQNRSNKNGLLLLALFVSGLTSYEAYIIALPLALLVDVMIAMPQNNMRVFVRRCFAALYHYLPIIALAGLYLLLRAQGINADMDERSMHLYRISWGPHIWDNIGYQLSNAMGLLHMNTSKSIVLGLWAFIAFLAWRAGMPRVWILCAAWIVLALMFFCGTAANGQSMHYGSYLSPPLAMFIVLALSRLKPRRRMGLFVAIATFYLIANHAAYAHRELWGSSETTRAMDVSFKALPQEARDRDALVVMNADRVIAWRIHWGMLFNIHRPLNDRYDIRLPQAFDDFGVYRPAQDMKTEASYLYTEQLMEDDYVFRNIRLVDVTPHMRPDAQWRAVKERMRNVPGAVQAIWSPPAGSQDALTVRFKTTGNAVPYLEAFLGENRCIVRFGTLSEPVYSMTFPPRVWGPDDRVVLGAYGLGSKDRFEIVTLEVRAGVWLPEADQSQQCKTALFAQTP